MLTLISKIKYNKILKTHMTGCVKDALKSEKEFDSKVEELIKTLKR